MNQGCFKPGNCRLDVAQASDLGPVSLSLPTPVEEKKKKPTIPAGKGWWED